MKVEDASVKKSDPGQLAIEGKGGREKRSLASQDKIRGHNSVQC